MKLFIASMVLFFGAFGFAFGGKPSVGDTPSGIPVSSVMLEVYLKNTKGNFSISNDAKLVFMQSDEQYPMSHVCPIPLKADFSATDMAGLNKDLDKRMKRLFKELKTSQKEDPKHSQYMKSGIFKVKDGKAEEVKSARISDFIGKVFRYRNLSELKPIDPQHTHAFVSDQGLGFVLPLTQDHGNVSVMLTRKESEGKNQLCDDILRDGYRLEKSR